MGRNVQGDDQSFNHQSSAAVNQSKKRGLSSFRHYLCEISRLIQALQILWRRLWSRLKINKQSLSRSFPACEWHAYHGYNRLMVLSTSGTVTLFRFSSSGAFSSRDFFRFDISGGYLCFSVHILMQHFPPGVEVPECVEHPLSRTLCYLCRICLATNCLEGRCQATP